MTYFVFVPLLTEDLFKEITEDILPEAKLEMFGSLSRIELQTEAETVMLKLALPDGWMTSGVYSKDPGRPPVKINADCGETAIQNNKVSRSLLQ